MSWKRAALVDAHPEDLGQHLDELPEVDPVVGDVIEDGLVAVALILDIAYFHVQVEVFGYLAGPQHGGVFTGLGLAVFFEIIGLGLTVNTFEVGVIKFHAVLAHLQQDQTAGEGYDTDIVAGVALYGNDVALFETQVNGVFIVSLAGVLELHLDHFGVVVRLGNIRQPVIALELPAALRHHGGRLVGRGQRLGRGIVGVCGLFTVHIHLLYAHLVSGPCTGAGH